MIKTKEPSGSIRASTQCSTVQDLIQYLLHRFKRDFIYTWLCTGKVLISINPYKPLANPDLLNDKNDASNAENYSEFIQLQPHLQTLINLQIHLATVGLEKNQIFLTTGESGAGKTTTITEGVAKTWGKNNPFLKRTLHLLHCFGNSVSSIHSDASNFTGIYSLYLDHNGDVHSFNLKCYSVFVNTVPNFHIFNILIHGGSSQFLRKHFLIRDARKYPLVSKTSTNFPHSSKILFDCKNIDQVFHNIKLTLSLLPHGEEILNIVASLLLLSTLKFTPTVNDLDSTETIDVLGPVEEFLSLLGYQDDPSNFKAVLVSFDCHASEVRKNILLSVIYRRLFLFIVRLINISQHHSSNQVNWNQVEASGSANAAPGLSSTALYSKHTCSNFDVNHAFYNKSTLSYPSSKLASSTDRIPRLDLANFSQNPMGKPSIAGLSELKIVDYPGFRFEGSKEAFYINYEAERIQQFVNDLAKKEQELYSACGVRWIRVATSWTFNWEASPLLEILDQTDDTENDLLKRIIEQASNIETSLCKLESTRKTDLAHPSFVIRHFVTPVAYNAKNFLEKNEECLVRDLLVHLRNFTDHPVLTSIISEVSVLPSSTVLGETPNYQNMTSDFIQRSTLTPTREHYYSDSQSSTLQRGRRKMLSSLARLKLESDSLIRNLNQFQNDTSLYLIKCLKPNDLSRADLAEPALLTNQARYHGLLDWLKIYKDGFAYSMDIDSFIQRYKLLSLETWPSVCLDKFGGRGANVVRFILTELRMDGASTNEKQGGIYISSDYVGGTVLFEKMQTVLELEALRAERKEDLAIVIQKAFRGYKYRRKFLEVKRATKIISKGWHTYKNRCAKRNLHWEREARDAVVVITRAYIKWKSKCFLQALSITIKNNPDMRKPSNSEWLVVPSFLRTVSNKLRFMFHRQRCLMYRLGITDMERGRMSEKLTASHLFSEKKASYPRSVPHPFQGDYIRLRFNSQWRRRHSYTHMRNGNSPAAIPGDVVFADLINKVSRSSGKLLPTVVVVTLNAIEFLDPRSLMPKYQIPLCKLQSISVSPYEDDIGVLHVKRTGGSSGSSYTPCDLHAPLTRIAENDNEEEFSSDSDLSNSNGLLEPTRDDYPGSDNSSTHLLPSVCVCSSSSKKDGDDSRFRKRKQDIPESKVDTLCLAKGDVMVHTLHLIEMIAKIVLSYKYLSGGKALCVQIASSFPCSFGDSAPKIEVEFHRVTKSTNDNNNLPTMHNQLSREFLGLQRHPAVLTPKDIRIVRKPKKLLVFLHVQY